VDASDRHHQQLAQLHSEAFFAELHDPLAGQHQPLLTAVVVPLQTEALVGFQVQSLDLVPLANGQHSVPAPGAQATEAWRWFRNGLFSNRQFRRIGFGQGLIG
jgi:hypothetical protein